ncbi:MAG: bacteriohemerythrin [Gammaproteobacteria bacterium]|nr:bacteriohemerythrin [Gammaproteobacteria bacterium]
MVKKLNSEDSDFFEIFPWNDNFETGIPIIDEQHQKLVDILNQLAGHLAYRSSTILLNKTFDELAAYAHYHFETEEAIWKTHLENDESFQNHEKTHKSFIDKVVEIKQQENSTSFDDVIHSIVSFLTHWLAYHILDTDKRMAKVILSMDKGLNIKDAKIKAEEEMSGSMKMLIETVLTMYDGLSSRTMNLMREKSLRKQAEKKLLLSEKKWQFITENEGEFSWDWDIENNKTYLSNETREQTPKLFHPLKTPVTSTGTIHPNDLKQAEIDFKRHLEGKTDFYQNKHRVLKENGGWDWFISRGKVISRNSDGQALRMVGTHTDITQRELVSMIFEYSAQGMVITDTNSNITSVNPAFCKITGYSEEDVIGTKSNLLSEKYQNEAFHKTISKSLDTKGYWSGEVWNKRKNGELFPQDLSIKAIKSTDDVVESYISLISDITEKKNADKLIKDQANFDLLTKLPNRRMFSDRLHQEIKRSFRSQQNFALLFIDLDHFKDINDTQGHEAGDKLLIQAADRIRSIIRNADTVARLGGDEFTVIIPHTKDSIIVERIALDIIHNLKEVFTLGTNKTYISASIGITIFPTDATNATDLLKHADQAMYKAKESGRNCYRYFTPSMQKDAIRRNKIQSDLRLALDKNKFELYYQPIINLSTNNINKAEALIRWHHPESKITMPNDFIPIAEESGIIIELGDWVYNEAIKQTKIWVDKIDPDFQVSINISPVQFQAKNKYQQWLDKRKDFNLNGINTVIEITENLLMENQSDINNQLLELRNSNIQIALDDFGTGYSSLSYLQKFEIDYLKIDKSFVFNLTKNSSNYSLCKAIITMAKNLGIKVIAEGIENKQQHHLLKQLGCDYGQGYYYSKPIPVKEFEYLIANQSFSAEL